MIFRDDTPDIFRNAIKDVLIRLGIEFPNGCEIRPIIDESSDIAPRSYEVGDKKITISFARVGTTMFVVIGNDGSFATVEQIEIEKENDNG